MSTVSNNMELYNPGAAFHYTSEWNTNRTHPVTGQVRPHRGEDWGAPAGTSIPAAGAGKVVYKGTMNGYGNLVVLEHANGTEIVHTLYAHMSAPSPLALGASVAKGATVGPCGNTGIG
ncbi:M23 family metallopeptidase, partial [Pseudomonas viridiflava]|uniref:M23 family metallopeptidase n=1 Tax=Pseudomonas viridiflava TaxID=33069 RepID=UPI003C7DB524